MSQKRGNRRCTLDHTKPLDIGGEDSFNNTTAMCFTCNQEKANDYLISVEEYPIGIYTIYRGINKIAIAYGIDMMELVKAAIIKELENEF